MSDPFFCKTYVNDTIGAESVIDRNVQSVFVRHPRSDIGPRAVWLPAKSRITGTVGENVYGLVKVQGILGFNIDI